MSLLLETVRHRRCLDTRLNLQKPGVLGFSLLGTLIGGALIVITMAGAIGLMISGTITRSRTETIDLHHALIDDDISRIRQLAKDYTWCGGAADLTGTGDPCGNGAVPGEEDYYFPDSNTTWVSNFESACSGSGLINPFIARLNDQTVSPDNDLLDTSGDPIRAAAEREGTTNRVRIFYYNQDLTVSRRVTVTPTVANWCP